MGNLKIYYQNVRGIRSKTRDVKLNILSNNFDILIFTETWLCDGVFDGEFIDNRYTVYRKDRKQTEVGKFKNGGGVMIAVNNSLESVRKPEWESNYEDLWITVNTCFQKKSSHIAICAAYLPPPITSESLDGFLNNTSKIIDINKYSLVIGDFNISKMSWSKLVGLNYVNPSCNCNLHQIFVDFMEEHDLKQFNSTVNANNRILDLVLSNYTQITVTRNTSPVSLVDSHHPPLDINLKLDKIPYLKDQPIDKYNFYKADYNAINKELDTLPWLELFKSCESVNSMLAIFYDKLNYIIEKHVPKTRSRNQKYPIWYNNKLIYMLKQKNKFRLKYKIHNNPLHILEFQTLRSITNNLIKECYNNYIKSIEYNLGKNPKYFWTHLKNIKNSSNSYPTQMVYADKMANDGITVCNLFADYFASNFNDHDQSYPTKNFTQHIPYNPICTVNISTEEVIQKLKRLDIKKGAGPDNLPPILIHKCAISLSKPITSIFIKSLQTGTFPDLWKRAKIVPIYKKGGREIITNYRPISILSVLAKVFESLIYPTLSRHVQHLLSPAQHGFVSARSTITNLSNCMHYVTGQVDARQQVDTIYTDFSKAFDKVSHKILISKLSSFGIGGSLLSWLSSYLVNRYSFVVVKGASSYTYKATSGVPQGSILGPLLFNVFINDISNCFQHSKYFIFADDLKFCKSISNSDDARKLQEDIDRVADWCSLNKMDLNIDKCSIISFTRKRCEINTNYTVNNVPLQKCEFVRDLGITIDAKLRFNIHIDSICRSARKMLGFIFRNAKPFKKTTTKVLLYTTLVRSKLEYGTVIWNPHYQVYKDRLESIQRKFTKFYLIGPDKKLPYNTRLKRFQLNSLSSRRKLIDMIFLHKVANGTIDNPDLLSQLSLTVPSRLRRIPPPLFTYQIFKTNLGNFSLLPRLVKEYNKLITKDKSIDVFFDNLRAYKQKILKIIDNTD